MTNVKIVVEKHPDGYIAYPLGIHGIVVGEGDTYKEAVADVKSAIRFHVETFGPQVLEESVLEAYLEEPPVEMQVAKFPIDAPKQTVIRALQNLGFVIVREGNHIAMFQKSRRKYAAFLTGFEIQGPQFGLRQAPYCSRAYALTRQSVRRFPFLKCL